MNKKQKFIQIPIEFMLGNEKECNVKIINADKNKLIINCKRVIGRIN